MNEIDSQFPIPSASIRNPLRDGFVWLWRWFWRLALVVSLPYAWYSFYVPSNDIAWAADYPSAQRLAEESGRPLILFFTGEWCVPCRVMKRQVWADDQVASMVNAKFIALTIDIDAQKGEVALAQYPIVTTPTTIIAEPGGMILRKVEGGMSREEFLEMLESAGSNRDSG